MMRILKAGGAHDKRRARTHRVRRVTRTACSWIGPSKGSEAIADRAAFGGFGSRPSGIRRGSDRCTTHLYVQRRATK